MPDAWLFGILAVIALGEVAAPRRRLTAARSLRWPTNVTLGAINVVLLAAFAAWLSDGPAAARWGLLHRAAVPGPLAIAFSVVALDALSYASHRLLHRVPALWAVHRVHHADSDCDSTTGFRFHPGEALLTNGLFAAAIAVLGLPALGVVVHQVLAMTLTIAEHANVRVPPAVDQYVRRVLVTPDMHRVHHSAHAADSDTNFATIFPIWDRWFGTYRAEPADGHEAMRVGLDGFRTARDLTLPSTLVMPFRP
ncbi:MAG TPA: sterol desaturase family protein [Methylomirabilota bacterium]|jgi:sterol desaturase/sphingolipid hydroxylase (fatty acid hydroxylase superfamily)|nr:sterol desaturase family protein [Methylomirabilota bacterium]